MLITELDLSLDVGARFDRLGVRWCIGGSVASSLYGIPRATLDVDLVADLRAAHAAPWGDVVGVVRARRELLDREYLVSQAEAAGIAELLDRVLNVT